LPPFNAAEVFAEEYAKAVSEEVRKSGFELEDWFWSGRYDGPTSVERWYEQGPEMVQAFIDWYEANPDVKVWVTPDGQPAIELPVEAKFGTVPVKMVLDAVFQVGTALVVTDIKTSATKPVSYRQLGIYASGLELAYGVRPRYGTFFMNRGVGPKAGPKTHFLRPVELDRPQYSVAYLTAEFEQAEKGIQGGVFPASPGEGCGRCGVAWACTEVGGPEAAALDPNWPKRRS
jgi:putative RecB family exonuclease